MFQTFLLLLFFLGKGNAALITTLPKATPTIQARIDAKINAIVPTTTGQIGINPVESDLGDPSTYVGSIYGTDTKYITVDSWTTKVSSKFDRKLTAYSALVDQCEYTIHVNGWHFHG